MFEIWFHSVQNKLVRWYFIDSERYPPCAKSNKRFLKLGISEENTVGFVLIRGGPNIGTFQKIGLLPSYVDPNSPDRFQSESRLIKAHIVRCRLSENLCRRHEHTITFSNCRKNIENQRKQHFFEILMISVDQNSAQKTPQTAGTSHNLVIGMY